VTHTADNTDRQEGAMGSERYLNPVALHARLDEERAKRQTTWRAIGDETRLPNSTFTRLRQGRGIHADAFLSILHWLGDCNALAYASTRRLPKEHTR
jgi:hypothetical protein